MRRAVLLFAVVAATVRADVTAIRPLPTPDVRDASAATDLAPLLVVLHGLLPGPNHPREDAALTPQKADANLRWLEAQRRVDAWS